MSICILLYNLIYNYHPHYHYHYYNMAVFFLKKILLSHTEKVVCWYWSVTDRSVPTVLSKSSSYFAQFSKLFFLFVKALVSADILWHDTNASDVSINTFDDVVHIDIMCINEEAVPS